MDGDSIYVTMSISRALKSDDVGMPEESHKPRCYGNSVGEIKDQPCIEGGILVYDSWKGDYVDQLVAFVFRQNDSTSKRIGYRVEMVPDDCPDNNDEWKISGERIIRVLINEAFRPDQYGYTINQSEFRATIHP